MLRLLATAPIAGVGRVVYSSNACFLVEFEATDPVDPAHPLRGIYKPARGERPLWDFPHRTLHYREVASYLVDAALGLGIVPPTVLRDGPFGAGSMQLFVDAVGRDLSTAEEDCLQPELRAMAALDVLINNADRKSAHLLISPGPRLRGIDNALTFLPYPRQRTVLIELGGARLPDQVARAVQSLQGDDAERERLLQHLRLLLSAEEVSAFAGRLAELAADPLFPQLDPWDGRPFEWW